jgi:anti-sigma factor RsiW
MEPCLEMAPLLALAPDELAEPGLALPLQAHLERCPACRERQAMFAQVRAATARGATRPAAPLALHERIVVALRAEEAAAAPQPAPRPAGRGPWFFLAGGWMAAGALACALFMVLQYGSPETARRTALPQIALATAPDAYFDNHARALVTGHLIDVVSSDRHTVKPWFRGRLDFSPPVADLAAQGFVLLGGRLEYVEGRTVAVLVYQRRQHVIDLFVHPEAAPAGNAARQADSTDARGFRSVHGSAAAMAYTAISDLDPTELHAFALAYAGAIGSPADSRQ